MCTRRSLPVLLAVVLIAPALRAQNCGMTSVGRTPLNDLGAGTYAGFTGGLYPGGLNVRPPTHEAAGLAEASAITPLSPAGIPDPGGKIVLVSIGMSNTTQEFSTWLPISNADPMRNPSVVVVDGAQGGQDAVVISNPNANFWNVVNQRLANAGVGPNQVQAVWLKEAIAGVNGAFPADANQLKGLLRTICQILKTKFPNVRICYISSRIYAGYATTSLNPEPYAYQSGFAVKWLIEDQIQGDPSLNFNPSAGPVLSPWLSFGPYLWADGLVPRSDGLIWQCSDFNSDGTHPSPSGRQKVANLLQAHFSTDTTSTPWYYGSGGPGPLPAAVVYYGTACPGTNGTSQIVTNSTPYLGNPSFGIGVQNARPQSLATLFASLGSAELSLGACTVWIEPAAIVLPAPGLPMTLTTNAAGNGFFLFAITSDPSITGLELFTEWAIADPQGALVTPGGNFALTSGARLRFGPQS